MALVAHLSSLPVLLCVCAAERWNEWIPVRSKRLARYRSNTSVKPVDRPFNLRLEADGLYDTVRRLNAIKLALESRVHQQPEPAHPPLTASHPFAPLTTLLSSLLSPEELQFLTSGDNFKFIGHVVNAQLDDSALLRACLSFLHLNVSFLSYAFLTESTLSLQWCEMFARLVGGAHHSFYSHFGVGAGDKEEDFELGREAEAKEVKEAKPPRQVFASRDAAARKGQSVHTYGISAGVAVPSEKDKGGTPLPSMILIALINRFGREGGFTALQRLVTAQMQPASPAAPAAAITPPTLSSTSSAISPASAQPAATIPAAASASPSSPSVSPLYPIAYLVRGLAAIRLLLEPAFAHAFISSLSLPALVRHHLHSISDEDLKALDKSALQSLVKDVQSLLLSSTVYDVRGCVEFAETSTLHMSLRMIQAQVLATRIEGIVQLENTINTVKATSSSSSSSSSTPPTSTFTPTFLAQWLEDNRVVESLLGRDSHEQIVKRSPTILKFLAQQHKLQGKHLELLYQAMLGKHEGVVRIVYELLTDLAQVLNEEMLDLVFHRLQEKPLSEYREFDLHIVRQFTLNAVKNRNEAAAAALKDTRGKAATLGSTGERKWYGLNIFWDLLNDPSISPTISQLAATSLAQLLASPECKSQLPVYLDKCLSTLGGGKGAVESAGNASAVVPALQLAQLMIEKQPETSVKGVNSRSELIGQLELDRKVLSVLVDNLVQYERSVLGSAAAAQVTDAIVVSGHLHGVQLSTRFNFLSFLLSSSYRLMFTQAHLELLWSTFISPQCPASDQSLLLNWLTTAVNGKDPKDPKEPLIFPKKLTRFIFAELLGSAQRIDYASLTVSGYDLFEAYFVFLNKDNDALLTANRALVTVLQHRKLEGVDPLWSIIISARDRTVLITASHFLTTLYLRVDATLKSGDKRDLLRKFIDRTFAHLTQAINADGKASKSIGKDKETVKSITKRGSGSTSSSSSLFSSSQDLTIFSDSLSSRLSSLVLLLDLFLARLSRGDLLDAPRFRAGQQVRATWKSQKAMFDAQVRAVNKDGTYLVHYSDGDVDERTPERNLHSLEREERERREREVARERERREQEARGVVVIDEADDSDAAFPRNYIANSAPCFELLFRLLGTANSALGQQVSELLAKIPVNAELASSIRQLGMSDAVEGKKEKAASAPVTPITDWNALLPPTSVPKLLYTLRVIRGFAVLPPDAAEPVPGAAAANGAGEGEAARAAVVRWNENFVMRGGFKQLYHLICIPDARLDEWMDDSLSQKCLALLLELFHSFIALPSIRVAVLDQVDAPKLAIRLLAIAQAAVQLAMKEEATNTHSARITLSTSTPSQKAVAPPMMGPALPPVVPAPRAAQSVAPTPPSSDDTISKLVRYSLLSLNLLLLAQPLLISTILASPAWDRLLSDGILSPLQPFRLALQTSLLTLCSAFPALTNFCLPRLLHRLHSLDTNASAGTCQEYFDVVRRLILSAKTLAEAQPPPASAPAPVAATAGDGVAAATPTTPTPARQMTAPPSPPAPLYDTVELMTLINAKITQHPMLETSTLTVDHMLLGLLTLAQHILPGESPSIKAQLGSTLIPHLLSCLFDTPTSASRAAQLVQPPKCKSIRSRDVTFTILNELALDCPSNSLAIISAILPYHFTSHSSGANIKDWAFEPRHEEKSITGYLGLQNLGCTCGPERDFRLLTDRGFLFLREVEAALDSAQDGPLLFACYNPHSRQLEYHPGHLIVKPAQVYTLVNFTSHGDAQRLKPSSDELGAAGSGSVPALPSDDHPQVSLRVTGDHDMYVQLGERSAGDSVEYRWATPYHKVEAAALQSNCGCPADDLDCDHRRASVRMLAAAVGGVQRSSGDVHSVEDELASALALPGRKEVDAFLELYGYWLSAGSVDDDGVQLSVNHCDDLPWLTAALTAAGLCCGRDYHAHVDEADSNAVSLSIINRAWVVYFNDSENDCKGVALQGDVACSPIASAPDSPTSSTDRSCTPTSAHLTLMSSDDEEDDDWSEQERTEQLSGGATSSINLGASSTGRRFWWWVLRRCDREQLRSIIRGMQRASANGCQHQSLSEGVLVTADVHFRDQLVHALLNAGYTATAELHRQQADQQKHTGHLPVSTSPLWRVCYADGRADGMESNLLQPSLERQRDIHTEEYYGRVWCVSVPTGLIVAQRAEVDSGGLVSTTSRPVLVGNCIAEGTLIALANGTSVPIERVQKGAHVLSYYAALDPEETEGLTVRHVHAVLDQGIKECVELLFSDAHTLVCTPDHRIRTADGRWVEAKDLLVEADEVAVGVEYPQATAVAEGNDEDTDTYPPTDKVTYGVHRDAKVLPLFRVQLVGRREVGVRHVYDLSVPSPQGDVSSSFVANGVVVHNCYMNAPLQQLFMIPAFRSALLSIDTYRDAGDPPNMNESLLYQVQLLFGMLQESEQQSCSPAGLCHAFKDVDGKPTDVRIQVDSGEFTLHLLDRLCMTTKGTPFEAAIPAVLGGVLCHELIGRGDCHHYRERSEDFYGLSLEVQNKKTLTESLQAFIEGEVLEGGNQYKCDKCIAEGTLIALANGTSVPIERVQKGAHVLSYYAALDPEETEGLTVRHVHAVLDQGIKECVELLFSDAHTLVCTPDHRIRTADGRWVEAKDLLVEADEVAVGVEYPQATAVAEGNDEDTDTYPPTDKVTYGVHRDAKVLPLFRVQLVGRREVGVRHVYDLSVPSPQGDVSSSFVANGVVVHNCQRKVDTVKRVCIRALPPSLFFILKRFQLDYNTMETIKINDRLEFPHYLDMRPYTKEALPLPAGSVVETATIAATSNGTAAGAEEGKGKEEEGKQSSSSEPRGEEYYQYVLRGVVVHTGSASGGHYYSFIQERGDPSATSSAAPSGDAVEDEGRWLKMNDSVVTFFDPKDIPDECFGGIEEAPVIPQRGASNKDGAQAQASVFEKYRNGYLVFYDRVKKPVDIRKANQAIAAQFAAASAAAGGAGVSATNPALKGKGPIARPSSSSFLATLNGSSKVVRSLARLPPAMYAMIWKQNMAYWRDKAVFDRGYFDFVYKLVAEAAGKDKQRRSSLKQLQTNNGAATGTATAAPPAAATPPSSASHRAAVVDGHQPSVVAADRAAGGDALDAMMKDLANLSTSDQHSSEFYAHQVCQLATRFFLMTFCRARSKEALPQWVVVLKRLYSAEEGLSSLWLLHLFTLNQGEWIREYLLECPDAAIRSHIADVLGIAINHVVPTSLHLFAPDGPKARLWKLDEARNGDAALAPAPVLGSPSTVATLEPSQVGAGVLLEFGNALVGLLNLSAYYWRTFDSYFRLFAHFASSSPLVARWLVQSHGLVGRLLDYFLGEHSLHPELNALPVNPHTQKRLPMRDEYNTAEWHRFLALISQLIVQCQQPQTLPVSVGSPQAALPQLCPSPGLVPLTEKEMALLLYPDINNGFLVHLLQLASGRKKGQIVSAFVLHLCYDNPPVSDLVVACIRRGLEWFDWDSVRSYFRVLTSLVQLKDSLQTKRVAQIMAMLLEVITRQAKFWKITDLVPSTLALHYSHPHSLSTMPVLTLRMSRRLSVSVRFSLPSRSTT